MQILTQLVPKVVSQTEVPRGHLHLQRVSAVQGYEADSLTFGSDSFPSGNLWKKVDMNRNS